MSDNPNSFETFKHKLSSKTLEDIEGLNPEKVGFMREECCGAIPAKMSHSMKFTEHIILGSNISYKKWSKNTDNVPGYNELKNEIKAVSPDAMFTVSESPEGEGEWLLRLQIDPQFGTLTATQYFMQESHYDLPWKLKGSMEYDRSDDFFIFVCAHRTRDERCGFCGAVLVDLFRGALIERLGEVQARRVGVYPCSHVGGHVYAGNVIVYSRHGGVCFGLFKPSDIPTVVNAIVENNGRIPISLRARVRGTMYGMKGADECITM